MPRALSREHRFAAAVVDPGVVDVSTTLLDHFPHSMAKLLAAGEKEKLDRNMQMGERFSKDVAATVALRFRPYGLDSTFDVLQRAEEMRLTADDIAAITTPMLVTDPEDEQFWPGQAQELFDGLPAPKVLVPFTREEGANFHCEPMGLGVRSERVFDWLDDIVPRLRARRHRAGAAAGSGLVVGERGPAARLRRRALNTSQPNPSTRATITTLLMTPCHSSACVPAVAEQAARPRSTRRSTAGCRRRSER